MIAVVLPCYNVGEKTCCLKGRKRDARVFTNQRSIIQKIINFGGFPAYSKSVRQRVIRLRIRETDAPDYIKEAKKKTDFLILEEEEKEMIMKIDKARAIAEAELEYARDEGMEKGLEIGIEKGRQEEQKRNLEEKRVLIQNLMKTSLPLKEISEISGVDIETLKKWKAESK